MPNDSGIDAETAFGEALGASLLMGVLLKTLVQKGIFSNPEVVHIIDHVLLHLEQIQENAGAPKKAVARTRKMLEDHLQMFSGPRPRH